MNRNKRINELFDNIYNIKHKLIHQKYRLTDSKTKNILNRNGKFKNIHEGQRCFILGNGPSLEKENLDLLKNEVIFTVNQLYKSDIFEKVNSNYHVIIDTNFFVYDESHLNRDERVGKMKEFFNSEKVVFLHHAGKNFISNLEVPTEHIHFVKPKLIFTDKFNEEIDLTHLIPQAQTVVQTAIYIAMYMGFKEIYILGCEMTGILQNYVKNDDVSFKKNGHAYEYSENEKKDLKNLLENLGNEKLLWCFFRMFELFRKINEYSKRQEIVIKNLTTGGALDIFERDRLENIIKVDKS